MDKVTILGINLAKPAFQLHGVDAQRCTVLRHHLPRSQMLGFFQRLPPCLIGIEACAGAHYWARKLSKFGHEVRFMQPNYVKANVIRGKTSALVSALQGIAVFKSGWDLSACLRLIPKPHSKGSKERLGRISKMGSSYLRRLLYLGAIAQVNARWRSEAGDDWLSVEDHYPQELQAGRDRLGQPYGAHRICVDEEQDRFLGGASHLQTIRSLQKKVDL